MNAWLVHVRYAHVYLDDLPAAFDGTKVLFISDVRIRNEHEEKANIRFLNKLLQLNADMLILGGDYSAQGPAQILGGGSAADNEEHAVRFIESLQSFNAPLGKFAVSGENDSKSLSAAFTQAGISHLSDGCAQVEKGGEKIYIAGLSDVSQKRTPYEEIGGHFSGNECVIAVAHNPSAYIGIRVAEAKGGGAWADLVLSGHTLGGQIKIAGRTLRTLPDEEARCLAGWHYTDDLPLLVNQGLGCEGLRLRLGSECEVWCLTLKAAKGDKSFLPKL